MIELHVLRRSDDGSQLLLAAHPEADSPGYAISVDGALLDLLDARSTPRAAAARRASSAEAKVVAEPEEEPEEEIVLPEGPLNIADPAEALETAHGLRLVREKQEAQVTSSDAGVVVDVTGEGAEASAGEAGADAASAVGVLAEQRGKIEVSDLTLHDAVLANLHRWNVRIPGNVLDEGWWVTKLGDKAWQISFRFLSRGRIHEAEWVLDTDAARLVPENELAGQLGWWKPQAQRKSRRRRGGRGRGRRPSGRRRN